MTSQRRRLPRFTDRILFRGLRASPICLGMVDSPRTIAAAFEAGINFFFLSADMHWPYYEASRRGLVNLLKSRPGIRDEIVVGVASYPTQPEFCSLPFIELIEAVPGLGGIDVAIMGGVYAQDFPPRLAVYAEHRRARYGGIRAIGASFHDRRAARPAIAHRAIDVAFVRYNPGHTGARTDLFPYCRRPGRARVYNFNSTQGYVAPPQMAALGLGREYWRPTVADCYRFAMSRPEVDGLLCAPRTPRQVIRLARALEAGPLDAEEERFLMGLAALQQARGARG